MTAPCMRKQMVGDVCRWPNLQGGRALVRLGMTHDVGDTDRIRPKTGPQRHLCSLVM